MKTGWRTPATTAARRSASVALQRARAEPGAYPLTHPLRVCTIQAAALAQFLAGARRRRIRVAWIGQARHH